MIYSVKGKTFIEDKQKTATVIVKDAVDCIDAMTQATEKARLDEISAVSRTAYKEVMVSEGKETEDGDKELFSTTINGEDPETGKPYKYQTLVIAKDFEQAKKTVTEALRLTSMELVGLKQTKIKEVV